jgi:hypothetical protein
VESDEDEVLRLTSLLSKHLRIEEVRLDLFSAKIRRWVLSANHSLTLASIRERIFFVHDGFLSFFSNCHHLSCYICNNTQNNYIQSTRSPQEIETLRELASIVNGLERMFFPLPIFLFVLLVAELFFFLGTEASSLLKSFSVLKISYSLCFLLFGFRFLVSFDDLLYQCMMDHVFVIELDKRELFDTR